MTEKIMHWVGTVSLILFLLALALDMAGHKSLIMTYLWMPPFVVWQIWDRFINKEEL